MKSHDDVFTADDVTTEEITFIAIEGAHLSVIQNHRVAVGPVDCPETRFGIEQANGEAFKGLAVQLGMKNVEIAETQQCRAHLLDCVKFLPFVLARQRFLQCAIADGPLAH